MGTWDKGSFDNDGAADWSYSFDEIGRAEGLAIVEHALQDVCDTEGYLDSDAAIEAIVACEVIARLGPAGGERSPYSESVDAWVERNPGPVTEKLVDLAVQAIDRILAAESELPDLWEQDAEWLAAMADLKRRAMAR